LSFATSIPLTIMSSRMDEGMSHLILLAVPMFILLGALIEVAGLARAMIAFLVALIGHLRGGLQYVLLGAVYLVSGISGAKAADMAAVAPALFPEMKKRGNKGRQSDLAPVRLGRHVGNHSAEHRADHGRFGDGRVHRRTFHPRPAAGRRRDGRAVRRRLLPD